MTKNLITPNLKIKKKKSFFLLLPLFINYLMKSGKKTRALYILEKSLHLFSHLLLKKKLPYFTKSFLAFLPLSLKFNKEKNQNCTFFEYSKLIKIREKRNPQYSSFVKKNTYDFFYKKNCKKESVNVYMSNSLLRNFFFKKISKNYVREKSCYWYSLNKKKVFPDNFTYAQKNTFLFYFYKAIENVKPPLESRSLRFGGSNRQIPATVTTHRQWGYAIRWIIQAAENLKNSKTSLSKFEKNFPKEFFGGRKKSLLKTKKISGKTFPFFCFFLAEALLQAYYNRGSAIEKRNLWIENAISNRAFLRYRWW